MAERTIECEAHETRSCEGWLTESQFERMDEPVCEVCETVQWHAERRDMEWTYQNA